MVEDNTKKQIEFFSPYEDEKMVWEEVYNLSDYDLCSDYNEYNKSPFGVIAVR